LHVRVDGRDKAGIALIRPFTTPLRQTLDRYRFIEGAARLLKAALANSLSH
jgi:hypothetical protein